MDNFADEFDDLELRRQDKGKRPVHNPYSDSEEEYEEEEEYAGGYAYGDEEEEDDGDARAAAEEPAAAGAAGGSGAGARSPARGRAGAASVVDEAGSGLAAEDSEPGDLTCAICLNSIPLENLALVKGCDHMYCATCILHWALHKEPAWCPQCKQPFTHLLTYRTLDGELQDFPSEESVCLLKRARWFEEHLRFTDRAAASLVEESRLADGLAWQDYAHDYDLAEDEEIESFYFSSAAGRARVVLGNRRYGEGGFISGGRRQARPVVERRRSNKMGKAGEHAVVGAPPLPPPAASFRTPNACGGRKARPSSAGPGTGPLGSSPVPAGVRADLLGSSPGGASSLYGSSPSGSGRRARRNARRAAMDAGVGAAQAAAAAGPSSLGRSVS